MTTWELILVWVFWFIPPDWAYLQPTSFIGRIFPVWIHGVGVILFPKGQSALSWLLEGVRAWKLRRIYPGEKPLSFSYSRKDVVLPRSSPHGTCWQYPTSQWRWEPFMKIRWPIQSYLSRDYVNIYIDLKN